MKKKLIYGMFAIILGIGLSAANVSATSYDPTGEAGQLPNPPETPMILNHGMVGDALLGEFFRAVVDDTIGGVGPVEFATYVSIENVSSKWVAAHVRLRTGRYSVEVIDFPILLSPHDVFWFQFTAVPSTEDPPVAGEPSAIQIISRDEDTILKSGLDKIGSFVDGVLTMTLSTSLLDDFELLDAEYKKVKELTQGYIEVFGLFAIAGPVPDNFFDVMADLWADDSATGTPSYRYGTDAADRNEAVDVEKMLTGHVLIGDFTNGLYTGYTMKAIKDFRTSSIKGTSAATTDRRDWFARDSMTNGGAKVIPPAVILYDWNEDTAYREPDWATSFGPTWNDGDNLIGATPLSAVDSFSLDEVEDALVKQTLYGTYFNGGFSYVSGDPESGTYTIAVVTAPTKYLHYFFARGAASDGIRTGLPSGWGQWPVGDGPEANVVRDHIDIPGKIGTLAISAQIWNQKQQAVKGPSPYWDTDLPWELNLIPMGVGTWDKLNDFCFLVIDDEHSPFVKDVTIDDFPAGYWEMNRFQLAGILGDPRNTKDISPAALVQGYDRSLFGLLGELAAEEGLDKILPVSGQIMDFDFTNFPHARTIDPSWDNPTWGSD